MRRVELNIEHKYKDKYLGAYSYKSQEQESCIGSSREAQIRLLGDDVSEFHAYLDFDGNNWVLSDLGSQSGTWVRKSSIVEYKIINTTIVRIGDHLLKMTPHEIKNDLFVKKRRIEEPPKAGRSYHQVVLKKKGLVVDSLLLKEDESFTYAYKGKVILISPAKEFTWGYHTFGDVVVQNRKTKAEHIDMSPTEKVNSLLDSNLKKPLTFAGSLMFILFLATYFSPHFVQDKMKMIQPQMNQYTRVIYDAKSTKKSKARAKKLKQKIANKSHKKTHKGSTASSNKNTKAKPTKRAVVQLSKTLRKSGLSQLIGKISKRSLKNSVKIVSKGRMAGKKSGRALASVSSVSKIYNKNVKDNKSFKLNVIATKGKGGGDVDYKKTGSLTGGSVGSADVGIIEEETEVKGGLERDIISRYIQSQIGQVRYCYERQLSVNPDLYGKVTLKFTIGSSGEIVGKSIGTSTLKNAMVEGCILRRVARWKFPKPDGGTFVNVTYPFLFKSTN